MDSAFEDVTDLPFPVLLGRGGGRMSEEDIASLLAKEWVVVELDTGDLWVPEGSPHFPASFSEELVHAVGRALGSHGADRLGAMGVQMTEPELPPFAHSAFSTACAVFNEAVIRLIVSRHCRLPAFHTLNSGGQVRVWVPSSSLTAPSPHATQEDGQIGCLHRFLEQPLLL
jgi:hypothetical protein